LTSRPSPDTPALVLAADHRARGVATIEDYERYLACIGACMGECDGILATAQPLDDLVGRGVVDPARHLTYLSVNRTGLAGTPYELDDRLVATVERAADDGRSGIKVMTRIDRESPHTPAALELLGRVLDDARRAGVDALVEAVVWSVGRMSADTDDIVYAAVIAHDLGAPMLKVPVPAVSAGRTRVAAVERIVRSVGAPVLFLGGPYVDGGTEATIAEVVDVMAGGASGVALGRTLLLAPDPTAVAARVGAIVRRR
jgi:DhnA family fructose-bisphosphate aldolase class Ia